ncbi:ABC transporter substrate-binding protein [Actinomadura sp. LD22]|uniref:ABC transporter substrate-binding protein n=1 Tax=Actinomadura physcomitrii TaxID=2650748 RepID=A0A6I4MHM2_9ACTN|nr:ABC transporter substrate-binding protein [Actinomadura physcomitrii]MWA05292.1 ABC transporter substrate-binding protein [Actinomadura physcomitrii]MWA07117.1 ABC transporter substrate-binding protein [Actinomadura physcomitrii]
MRTTPIRVTAAAVAAVTALSVSACRDSRGGGDGGGKDGGTVKIMVGGIDKVIYLPAKLTEQLGYFKEQGLDVQLLTEPAGAQAENVLISGDVQGVVGFYDHTIDLQTKGKCVQSVVQMADVPGEAEMVASKKAASLASPAAFKGKKLGVTSPGSSTDFITRALAVRNGVKTSDYTTVKAGAGPAFISTLDNGGIDAGMTTDPTIAKLVSTGKAKVMVEMRTEDGTRKALGGLYPSGSLYMDCSYVKSHTETVQKLANAFVKTLGWIGGHKPAEIAAKMPADYAGGDPKLYEQAITDSISMFNGDGVMPADGAKNVLEVLAQFSPNVQGKKDQVDLSKTYTTQFVTKAKQS